MCRRLQIVFITAVIAAGGAGCGSDDEEPAVSAPRQDALAESTLPDQGPATGAEEDSSLAPPPCPADASNCSEASGEIIYVERVDPDGDGDAHFVLLSGESITGPGISVIDVRPELRPSPLPGIGDELAASGPVLTGSYGQSQIQADAVRVGD